MEKLITFHYFSFDAWKISFRLELKSSDLEEEITITCDECGGTGEETCYACDHSHDCEECNGDGYYAGVLGDLIEDKDFLKTYWRLQYQSDCRRDAARIAGNNFELVEWPERKNA